MEKQTESQINALYIGLKDNWATKQRLILRDCKILMDAGHRVFLYCYRDSMIDIKAKELGIQTIYHQGKMSTKIFKWHTLAQIPRLIRELGINLVHCYEIRLIWPLGYFLRGKDEIPLVLTQANQLKKFYRNIWYRPLASRIDLIMTPVPEMIDNIWGHLGIPPRKIEFCGLGLAIKDEEKKINLNLSTEVLNIGLHVSGQETESQVLEPVFRAIKVINENGLLEKKIHLNITSEKKWSQSLLYKEYQNMLWELNIGENVSFLDDINIVNFQRQIDVWFGLPQSEDLEDYSIKALLNSAPVLIPRTSASVELLRGHGKIGETYKNEDVREIRDKLVKILSNLGAYRRSLKDACTGLEILYSYDAYKERLKSFYEKVIKKRQMYVRRKKRYPIDLTRP